MESSGLIAFFLDEQKLTECNGDIRHKCDGETVLEQELQKIKVQYKQLDGDRENQYLKDFTGGQGYKNRDEVKIGKDISPNYTELLEKFKTEHIHEDEEVRYILEGSGYFDVRSLKDKWIRIFVRKGDFIVLPGGLYHRFTPDTNDYVHAMRLFREEPKWTPYNRPQEDNQYRIKYLQSLELQ